MIYYCICNASDNHLNKKFHQYSLFDVRSRFSYNIGMCYYYFCNEKLCKHIPKTEFKLPFICL